MSDRAENDRLAKPESPDVDPDLLKDDDVDEDDETGAGPDQNIVP